MLRPINSLKQQKHQLTLLVSYLYPKTEVIKNFMMEALLRERKRSAEKEAIYLTGVY